MTSIGRVAFFDCHSLANVTIPDSVETIGNNAFTRCGGIEQAFFAGRTLAQVKAIPDFEFDGNWSYPWGLAEDRIVPGIVEDVVLYTTADSETWLEGAPGFDASTGAFTGFARESDPIKVIVPSKVNGLEVTSIGDEVFFDDRWLTRVTIPNSVTSIGNSAFYYCVSLTSVAIPDSVTSIGDYAFYNCSGLTRAIIGNSVTSIGDSVFMDCSGLTSVAIPDSVTSIGFNAFYHCSGLTSVTMGSGLTSIGQ